MTERKRNGGRKPRVGSKIVSRLREFTEAIERGESSAQRFTCNEIRIPVEPGTYRPERVRQTRELLGASQPLFAQFLGVSVGTVRAWEQGANAPSDLARRFMDEIQHNPAYWQQRLRELTVPAARTGT